MYFWLLTGELTHSEIRYRQAHVSLAEEQSPRGERSSGHFGVRGESLREKEDEEDKEEDVEKKGGGGEGAN